MCWLGCFYLNGHTIGFCEQTQKSKLHYMPPELTLQVKGLRACAPCK